MSNPNYNHNPNFYIDELIKMDFKRKTSVAELDSDKETRQTAKYNKDENQINESTTIEVHLLTLNEAIVEVMFLYFNCINCL